MKKMYYTIFLFSLFFAIFFGILFLSVMRNSIIGHFQMTTGPDLAVLKWNKNLIKKSKANQFDKINYEEVFVKNELYDSNGPIYDSKQNYIVFFEIVNFKPESEFGQELYPEIEITKILNQKEFAIIIIFFILFVCSTIISSYGIWLTLLLPKVVV